MTVRRRIPELDRSNAEEAILVDINTTPLIDVMLVLLIMLIITIPIQTHAVRIDLPRADAPQPAAPPPVVRVEVDFDGTMFWNGTVLADRAALEQHLRAAATEEPQPEVHVLANKLAKYGSVAIVLAEAQRLGIGKLGIAAEAY